MYRKNRHSNSGSDSPSPSRQIQKKKDESESEDGDIDGAAKKKKRRPRKKVVGGGGGDNRSSSRKSDSVSEEKGLLNLQQPDDLSLRKKKGVPKVIEPEDMENMHKLITQAAKQRKKSINETDAKNDEQEDEAQVRLKVEAAISTVVSVSAAGSYTTGYLAVEEKRRKQFAAKQKSLKSNSSQDESSASYVIEEKMKSGADQRTSSTGARSGSLSRIERDSENKALRRKEKTGTKKTRSLSPEKKGTTTGRKQPEKIAKKVEQKKGDEKKERIMENAESPKKVLPEKDENTAQKPAPTQKTTTTTKKNEIVRRDSSHEKQSNIDPRAPSKVVVEEKEKRGKKETDEFRPDELPEYAKSYILPKVMRKDAVQAAYEKRIQRRERKKRGSRGPSSTKTSKANQAFTVSMLKASLDYEASKLPEVVDRNLRGGGGLGPIPVRKKSQLSKGPGSLKKYIDYVKEDNYVPIPVLDAEKGVDAGIYANTINNNVNTDDSEFTSRSSSRFSGLSMDSKLNTISTAHKGITAQFEAIRAKTEEAIRQSKKADAVRRKLTTLPTQFEDKELENLATLDFEASNPRPSRAPSLAPSRPQSRQHQARTSIVSKKPSLSPQREDAASLSVAVILFLSSLF